MEYRRFSLCNSGGVALTPAPQWVEAVCRGDSLDWKNPTPDQISARVLKRVQPGSIILFHNAAINTPAALPTVIEGLIQQGYTIVPVSQLILRDNFTMDHTGRQLPSAN